MVIPQELQIQKMIRPTHGIVIVKSVKRRASNRRIAAKSRAVRTVALKGEQKRIAAKSQTV